MVLIAISLLVPLSGKASEPPSSLVVVSADSGVYRDIVDRLEAAGTLAAGRYQVSVPDSAALPAQVEAAGAIITLGTRAAEGVFKQQPTAPVLSALITESGFAFLAGKHYGSIEQALQRGVSAIYLDQPLQRLYHLGNLLLPEVKRVGIIASDTSARENAQAFADRYSGAREVAAVTLASDASPIRQLNPLMRDSGFVIVLPGKKDITLAAARWILQLGSHTRTPVIAYSKKYARSGALAAVYTSPANVAEQLVEVLTETQMLRSASAGIYPPSRFSIEINRSVANKLDIPVEPAEHYRDEIQRLEGGP